MEESSTHRPTLNEWRVPISLVVPDAARPTLAAFRNDYSELDDDTLRLVDELLMNGHAALLPGWAAGAGAGPGEPDRGDNHIS